MFVLCGFIKEGKGFTLETTIHSFCSFLLSYWKKETFKTVVSQVVLDSSEPDTTLRHEDRQLIRPA